MARLERIANWCKPCIEGDSIVFRHAYKWGGKWYDLKAEQKDAEGRSIRPETAWIKARLQIVQEVALKEICPYLNDPGAQVVTYTAAPREECYLDKERASQPLLEGMRKIEGALNGEFGGGSLSGRSLQIRLKPYTRPPIAPREAPAAVPVEEKSGADDRAQFIETIDRDTVSSRFDPTVTYAQFERDSRTKQETPIYQAYLKLVRNPECDDEDAVRMRKWLVALHRSAMDYYKNLYAIHQKGGAVDYKKMGADALIPFIFVQNINTKKLIDFLMDNS